MLPISHISVFQISCDLTLYSITATIYSFISSYSRNNKLRSHVNSAKLHSSSVLYFRSRSVIRIHAAVRFEPSKVNIFNKDCRRSGKDVTCMSAIVCLNVTARTVIRPTQEVGQFSKLLILATSTTNIHKKNKNKNEVPGSANESRLTLIESYKVVMA